MNNRKNAFQFRLNDNERVLLNGIARELRSTPSAVVRTMIVQSATRLGINPRLQLGIAPESSTASELEASHPEERV